jgi:hypothetical protein
VLLLGADEAVELKLTPSVHGGHRRGWVAAHGLELLPLDQLTAEPSAVSASGSPLAEASPAFDKAGRWTALPTAPSAALLFSLRWGGGGGDPVVFVPHINEIIPLDELEGLGERSDLLGRGNFGEVYKARFRGREVVRTQATRQLLVISKTSLTDRS